MAFFCNVNIAVEIHAVSPHGQTGLFCSVLTPQLSDMTELLSLGTQFGLSWMALNGSEATALDEVCFMLTFKAQINR